MIPFLPKAGLATEAGASREAMPLASLRKALEEGLAHPLGGEVVVRAGETIGRIYLYKGAVAWVNCSEVATRVRDTLLAHSGINPEELDAALNDSRQQRRHFAETLLDWGLIDRERLWQCLLRYNALHLSAILQLRGAPQVLFVPLVRTYAAGMVFSLQQMLDACEAGQHEPEAAPPLQRAEPLALPPPREEAPPVEPGRALGHSQGLYPGMSERLAALLPTGVLAAALVDLPAREVCGKVFHMQELVPAQEELCTWLLSLLDGGRLRPEGPPREVLLVAEDSVHTVTRGTAYPSLFLWVMCDGAVSVGRCLAQGHLALKALEQELLEGCPAPAAEPTSSPPRQTGELP